jgi:hypothetical protein
MFEMMITQYRNLFDRSIPQVRYRHFAQSFGASNGLSTLLPAILRGQYTVYNISFRFEGKERLREIVRHAFLHWEFIFSCAVNLVQGKQKIYSLFIFKY